MSCQCAEYYSTIENSILGESLLELLLLNFQRNYTVEVQVSLLQKSWYSMTGGAGDVLHERASSNKMKKIHCKVQVIFLQKP